MSPPRHYFMHLMCCEAFRAVERLLIISNHLHVPKTKLMAANPHWLSISDPVGVTLEILVNKKRHTAVVVQEMNSNSSNAATALFPRPMSHKAFAKNGSFHVLKRQESFQGLLI